MGLAKPLGAIALVASCATCVVFAGIGSDTSPRITRAGAPRSTTTVATRATTTSLPTSTAPDTTATTSTAPDTTTTTSGAAAAPTTAAGSKTAPPTSAPARVPWFAPTASWNRPASAFGPSVGLQPYVDRLWNHGGGTAPPGTINVAFSEYSVPVYPVTEATGLARIYQTTWSMELYDFGAPLDHQIPWNPAWRAGTGNDNLMAIVDESTGRVWELGGVGQQNTACANRANVNAATRDNDARSTYLCLSGIRIYDNLFGASDGSTVDGRGAGINKMALLTRADEVKAGAIHHALQMTITSTMFGEPACTPRRGASAAGAGVSCGFFLPPATKLERLNPNVGCPDPQVVDDVERSKTVPEGMRFALNMSDAEIEQWLDARGYTGQLRRTARVFAVALRDYGWIIAETSCWGMHIETDSVIGAQAFKWAELGVTGDGSKWPRGDLLAGLFSPSRIYVVQPPA